MNIMFSRGALCAVFSLALASCTTTNSEMAKQPERVSQAALCRSYVQSQDVSLRSRVEFELMRRGISPSSCAQMVQNQNTAAAALVAVALIGGAVAYCRNHNCSGGGYSTPRTYRGNCEYDWQYDARGRRCGDRSAWSRPGGW